MPESAAYARRGYKGGAKASTIPAGLSDSATSFSGADLSTWAGATTNGPSGAKLDPGLSTEEIIEIGALSGNNASSVVRGVDGTTAVEHAANCVIQHVNRSRDADEANSLVSKILGLVGLAAGDLLYFTSSTVLARLAKGAAWRSLTMNQAATAPTWASGYPLFVFADATARDAAITSPVEGMHAWLTGTDVLTYYTGAAWATRAANTYSAVHDRVTTLETYASTSFGALATAQAKAITPGPSGLLKVTITAQLYGTASKLIRLGFSLSGGNTLAAATDRSLEWTPPGSGLEGGMSATFTLESMNQTSTTVTLLAQCESGATGSYQNRELLVETW